MAGRAIRINNKNSLLGAYEKLQSNFPFREFVSNSRYPRTTQEKLVKFFCAKKKAKLFSLEMLRIFEVMEKSLGFFHINPALHNKYKISKKN